MSGETTVCQQVNAIPYYAKVGQQKKCKNFDFYETQSEYDRVSRDVNRWHDKSILTAKQPHQDTSLYSVIQQEGSVRPVAVEDVNKESQSSMFFTLQVKQSSNDSLGVKSENADTQRVQERINWGLLISTMACFVMLLILFIAVAIVIFSQISIIKSQFNSLQKSMHDDTSFIQPSSKPEARQNIPPTTSSCCSNFSSLQTVLLDTKSNLNTLMDSINMTWGLNYSIVNDIYLADSHFSRVIDTIARLGTSAKYPASSCGNILAVNPASLSGMYWLRSSDGSSVSVFCDMNRTCDGMGGGWIKVGGFNVNNKCPENFTIENINGTENTCVPVTRPGCTSIKYFTSNISYSRVCGEVKGIGIDTPNGFRHQTDLIDENYVDGISITHGLPNREHIWTFAAERRDRIYHTCTCNREKPGFIKDNVYCMEVESMHENNRCECDGCPSIFNSILPQVTKDVIEIRVCTNQDREDEQVGISSADMYVQ